MAHGLHLMGTTRGAHGRASLHQQMRSPFMKMTMTNRMLAEAALLLLGIGTAAAQTENQGGFYAGGALGQFDVKIDGLDGVDEAIDGLDADDTAWKIFAGWRFNPYLAVEAAYVDFGRPRDRFTATGSSGDYQVELSGLAPFVVASVPLGPVELSGRIGYYFYDVKTRADFDDLTQDVFKSSDSGQDLAYGVGLGLTMFERLNARLEYERIDLEGADNSNAFWLSGAWRF